MKLKVFRFFRDHAPLTKLGEASRRLDRDERGQSIVYLVIMIFLLACFTFMVINSGMLIHDKMQAQSAADAAVLSGTTWIARGLNINSMLNIVLAMVLAQFLLMQAVFWAAMTASLMNPAISSFWMEVCNLTGVCTPATEVVYDQSELLPMLSESQNSKDFLENVMETISDIEASVHTGFRLVAGGESVRIALKNGAGFGTMYPYNLPEESGQMEDLCDPTRVGSSGGYDEFEYSFVGSLGQAVGEISGFSYSQDIRNMASNLLTDYYGLGGPLWGEFHIPYQSHFADEVPYHFTNVIFIMAVQARYGVLCGGGTGPDSVGYSIPGPWWCNDCNPAEISIPNPYNYLGAHFSIALEDSSNPNIEPYVLTPNFDNDRNFYGFAYKTPADIQSMFIPQVFGNTYGEMMGMVTVAQAQIYNPHLDGGMFSPHWRTHLSPVQIGADVVSALASDDDVAGFMGEGLPGAGPMMEAALPLLVGEGMSDVFAH